MNGMGSSVLHPRVDVKVLTSLQGTNYEGDHDHQHNAQHEQHDHSPRHLVKLRATNLINILETRKPATLNTRLVQ